MAADLTSLVIEVKSVGIKEASTALSGLGTSAANAERRINALIEATKKLNVANELAAKSTQSIVARLREQDALLGNMAANSRAAGRGTADLAAAMALLSASLNLMNQNIVRAASNQRAHNEQMREAHALARGLSGSLGALWVTYGNFAGMAVGLAIGASLKGVITIGKDVEATLEGIRVRGQESTESIGKMRDAIGELGKGVYGPLEVAKAFDVLILAGLRADQALIGIKDALNLATVGGTTIEKSAEVLVQVSTALGYTAEGFGRIADVIAKTAAVSISSVDGISESFKAASVVGKLYGQSLVDLGTQFAILSNLGIKNSAAGTASKNFFSDLASGSEKVTKGLGMLKLSIKDLQDEQGNFNSFNEVLRTLAGDGEKGFNSLTAANQKFVQSLITNERGNKLMTEGLDLIRTKGKETATALDDISRQINESWGFTARGAAAMALTVDAQFKSVKNTLQTVLVQAFEDIQPQLSLVATRLKAVFNSPEFISGVQALAKGAANLTVFIAENAEAVWTLVRAMLAWKAATAVFSLLTGAAEGFIALKKAMDLARISAVAFQASLGLLGIALMAGAAAIVWWSTKRDEAMGSDKQRAALNYMDDFKNKIDEENTRLAEQIKLMEQNKTATEAYTQSMQQQQLQRVKDQGAVAIADAQAAANKAKESISTFNTTKSIDAYNKALLNLKQVKEKVAASDKAAEESVERNIALSKKAAELAEKQAAARNVKPEGTGTLPLKVDAAAINDQYAAAIARLNAQVKAAKKDILNYDEKLNDEFKAGEIGKLQVIRESTRNQLEEYAKIDKALKEQIDIASKGKNKKADVERFSGLQEANTEAIEQAKRKAAQDTAVYVSGLRQDAAKEQVKQFEEEGNFVAAAALRWSTEYAPAVQAVQKDFEKYGDTIPEIGERLRQLESIQAEMMDSARVRELSKEYNVLALSIGNIIKGVKNESEDQGLAAMFIAAQDATEKYKASLPALQDQLEKLKRFAMADDATTGDKKAYEEALSQQKSLAEKYKVMWKDVSKSISTSLTEAFGKSGKAAGGVIEAITKYHNTDNKSLGAKAQLYGDVAKSAQGFFSESSKGYKLMGIASQAASAIEIASSLATIGPKVASGVASLFEQGGWAGFAGAAAFLAIMAGLGFSGGGSSSAPSSEVRQKMNGTGSVLGDSSAKSESIQKALDEIAKDSGLGLVHFNSMDKSLKELVAGISGLSSLLIRGTTLGGPVAADTVGSAQKFASSIGFASIGEKITGGLMSKVIGSIFGGKTTVEDVGLKMNAASLASLAQNGVNVSQYTDTKKKGGWFSSDKYSTETKSLGAEVNNQFSMIINSLSDTVKSAAEALGLGGKEFETKLSSFVVDIGEISTKGLTGEEIQKALETAFSKLGDDMAKFAIVGLDKFQKVGEGYLETVARVANELIQVQDVFAVLGKTMDVTGIAAVEVSQSLIGVFGGIDKLTESTSYFVDNFLTDADKLKPIQESLTKEMTRLGVASVDTVEEFKNLVLSQDLTTKSGQEMYAALMNVAPAFLAVSEASTKAEEKMKDLTNKRLSMQLTIAELEKDDVAVREIILKQRAIEIAGMDESLRPLQERINFLNDEADATAKAQAAAEKAMAAEKAAAEAALSLLKNRLSLQSVIADLEGNTADKAKIVAQQRAIELAAMDESLRPLQERINLLNDEKALQEQVTAFVKNNAQKDFDVLSKAIAKEKEALKSAYDAQVAITKAQITSLETVNKAVEELSDALDTALNSAIEAVGGMSRATAQALLTDALNTARATGKLPTADAMKDVFSTLGKDASGSFSSLEDFRKDAGITAGKISALNDITKAQKSVNELQLEALNKNLETLEKTYDAQVAMYDMTLAYAQQQLDAMNGTQVAVKDVASALKAFAASSTVAINNGIATGGISKPQAATTSQITDLYKNILGRAPDAAGLALWENAANKGLSIAEITSRFYSSAEYQDKINGSHASGADDIPFDNYKANLHKGEMVLPAAKAKGVAQGSDMAAIVEAIEKLHEDNSIENRAIKTDITKIRKILDNVTPDGRRFQVVETPA